MSQIHKIVVTIILCQKMSPTFFLKARRHDTSSKSPRPKNLPATKYYEYYEILLFTKNIFVGPYFLWSQLFKLTKA